MASKWVAASIRLQPIESFGNFVEHPSDISLQVPPELSHVEVLEFSSPNFMADAGVYTTTRVQGGIEGTDRLVSPVQMTTTRLVKSLTKDWEILHETLSSSVLIFQFEFTSRIRYSQ